MRNAAAAGGREREGEKLVIISRTNSLLCAVAKGGSGKVFFVSASSSYFLFKVGGGPPPPLTMWEMWFWVGGEKETEKQKCRVSSCGRPFSDGAEHWGYHGIRPPSPFSFPFFSFLFRAIVQCASSSSYCCCIQVCAFSSSRIQMCPTSCHTFCGRGKTLRSIGGFSQKCTIASAVCLSGGGRGVSNIRAPRAPQFCKTDRRPLPPMDAG